MKPDVRAFIAVHKEVYGASPSYDDIAKCCEAYQIRQGKPVPVATEDFACLRDLLADIDHRSRWLSQATCARLLQRDKRKQGRRLSRLVFN
jgi:hypothetical protein